MIQKQTNLIFIYFFKAI